MAKNYIKLQVKSSGQYLNILGGGNENGTSACQGTTPTADNFLWEIEAPNSDGWSVIQVKSSKQYLNIFESGNQNGKRACQGSSNTTVNFFWKIVEGATGVPDGWFLLQVQSSNQCLNIFEGGNMNGQIACQGSSPITPNFFWRKVPAASKSIIINLQIDCPALYAAQPEGGSVSNDTANADLVFSDTNNGKKENTNQSSFQSIVDPGSEVTWTASTKSGNNSEYSVRIDSIEKDAESENIFSEPKIPGASGKVNAQVLWGAMPPASGDNETYTVNFSIKPKNGTWIPYNVDPKLKIHT